jgi:hypothetical protein
MQKSNNGTRPTDTVLISGWVYADLLLGLMILFLVSTKGVDPATLVPTFTPTPTATSTATASPSPTSTAYRILGATLTPSMTPSPTATLTPTATPTVPSVGVNRTAYTVVLRINPDLLPALFAGDAKIRQQVQEQLKAQGQACFGPFAGKAKAGFLLAFGGNPTPGRGNELARLAAELLKQQYPDLFTGPVRNYHAITTNPYENGTIELQTFFMIQDGLTDVVTVYGDKCEIPPASWCQGNGDAQVVVFDWEAEPLKFVLNDLSYEVKTAKGENPTYACLRAPAGQGRWTASLRGLEAQGDLSLTKGKSSYLYFCVENGRLVSNCRTATKVTANP